MELRWNIRQKLSQPGILVLVILSASQVQGHGRLLEPPNRSSLWRFAQYQDLDPPVNPNYDDDQNYCGGLGNMVNSGGKCGPCGDPYDMQRPRMNENGGIYGEGIVVKNYEVGQVIDVAVELTTNHWGYFTFSLCKLQDTSAPEPEDCFDKYPLRLGDNSGFIYNLTTNDPGWYNTTVQLPQGFQCDHCVLRWHYTAGNNWEFCDGDDHENGSTTCGTQEVFRSCSDISIGRLVPQPMRPKLTSTTYPTEPIEHPNHPSPTNKATIPPMRPPVPVYG